MDEKQKEVMENKGTEAPFSGKWLHNKELGIYTCAKCGTELFSSDAKFDSGTGWPSFDRAKNIDLKKEDDGRIEVACSKCGSHLGHVFTDGPTDTGERYCINSVCLDFNKK